RQEPPCTRASDSSSRSSSRRERGSPSRSSRCRRHGAPWQPLRRTRAARRSVGRTFVEPAATGQDESVATRSSDRCDRSGGSQGGGEFRNRGRIPRLRACARGFLQCFFFLLLRTQQRKENDVTDGF